MGSAGSGAHGANRIRYVAYLSPTVCKQTQTDTHACILQGCACLCTHAQEIMHTYLHDRECIQPNHINHTHTHNTYIKT